MCLVKLEFLHVFGKLEFLHVFDKLEFLNVFGQTRVPTCVCPN